MNKDEFLAFIDGDISLADKLREKYRKVCKCYEDLPRVYNYLLDEEDLLLSRIVEGMIKYKLLWENSEKAFKSIFKYWFLNNFK
jgi:hypothetical protein